MLGQILRKMGWVVAVFALMVAVVACAASSSESQIYYDEAPVEMEESAADGSVSRGGESAPVSAPAMEVANTVAQTAELPIIPAERLIIRNGNLDILVADTEATLAQISAVAEGLEGWVVSSSTNVYLTAKQGYITIRVPATHFDAVMNQIKGMSVEVRSENSSGQDVTEEYVDLASRLGNLEATAARVRAFLDETQNVEEALAVNVELSRLEGEIEVIKGRMQYLSQSAAFSTISVSITPDIVSQPIEVSGWRPQGVFREAVDALIEALQWLGSTLIWLAVYFLPLFIVIILPAYFIGRRVWRWMRK